MGTILQMVVGFLGIFAIAMLSLFGIIILFDLVLSFFNSPNTFDF